MKKTAIWFPAKRYGWGWGLPIRWQGWVVLGIYLSLLVFIAIIRPPSENVAKFAIFVVVLSAGFSLVCWWKGEPPRWRWGNRDHRES